MRNIVKFLFLITASFLFLIPSFSSASTCVSILGSDTLSASRTTINTCFTNLNTDKYQSGDSPTFAQILANSSTTLQNFTALNSTSSNATTTNFYSALASTTNLFTSNITIGSLVSRLLSTNSGGQVVTTTVSSPLTFSGNTLACATCNTSSLSGSGTTNALTYWSSANALSNVGYITTLDSANRLGIGTTTPNWLLQLATSTTAQLVLSDSTNNHFTFRNQTGTLYIATSSPTTFATSTVAALVIDTSGNIGIGVNKPSSFDKLAVHGGIAMLDASRLRFYTGDNSNHIYCQNTGTITSNMNLGCYVSGATPDFIVTSAGLFGVATSSPGYQFQVSKATAPQIAITDGSLTQNQWTFRTITGTFYIATSSASTYATSTVPAVTINTSGSLGIGTSSPTSRLTVEGNAYVAGTAKVVGTMNIPSGASPTVSAAGDIAIDTTSGQFKWSDGVKTQVITGTSSPSTNIGSTTIDALGISFSTGTTTFLLRNSPYGVTMSGFYCQATSTGSVFVRFGNFTTWTVGGTCNTTGGFVNTPTNNTWTAYQAFVVQIGTSVSSPSRVTVTPVLNITAD